MKKKVFTRTMLIPTLVIAMAFGSAGSASAASSDVKFIDISSHWAKSAIESAVESGIVNGYPDGTFRPDSSVSRAEFLALATRSSNLPSSGGQEPFTDVAADHWAVDAINDAIGMGFIDPKKIGSKFEGNKALTRAEMVKWLVSGLVEADSSFAEALEDTEETILPFAEFYRGGFEESDIPYIAVARGTGLVGGFPHGSFGPDRTTTRAEVVVLLERYLGIEGTEAEDYKALNELREVGTTGTNVVTIANADWLSGPIYKGFNQELVSETKDIGTLKLNKLLLIDREMTSVYTEMFVGKEDQERMKKDNMLRIVTQITLSPSRDLDRAEFRNAYSSIAGSPFQARDGIVEKYGYTAMYSASSNREFLDEGKTSTFWTFSNFQHFGSVSIVTTDGKRYGFTLVNSGGSQ